MTLPKFIYFDAGNTFFTYDKIFTRVTNDFKIPLQYFDTLYEPYDISANEGKIDIPQVWAILAEKLNLKNWQQYNFIESWVSDYQAIPSMHQLAVKISQKFPIGILSNNCRYFIKEDIRQKFIPDLPFNPIIISAEVGIQKPDRRIYEIAQEQCKFGGDQIFFIDDKEENLIVPRTLGWQTFLFDYKNPEESVKELAAIL